VADRLSARTTSGRRGLLWAALALVVFALVADLARGDDSLLRSIPSLFGRPRQAPGEELLDRVLPRR
jgi:hypothetical protein